MAITSSASPTTIISGSRPSARSRPMPPRRSETLGVGALASRLVGGERSTHKHLEEEIAAVPRHRDGTGARLRLSDQPDDHHASHGRRATLSSSTSCRTTASSARPRVRGAEVIVFRHNDLDHLDELLVETTARITATSLIVVESALQHGRRHRRPAAPRRDQGEVIRPGCSSTKRIRSAFSARTAAGICEHTGVDPNRIDLIIGTMSKTLGLLRRLHLRQGAASPTGSATRCRVSSTASACRR